jgi:signal transduction histidine kinase
LTLLYTAVLGVVLSVFGVAAYWAFAQNQHAHLDDILRTRAAEIRQEISSRGIGATIQTVGLGHPGTYIQLVDGSGDVLDRNDALGSVTLPVDPDVRNVAAGRAASYFTTTAAAGVSMRMLVAPIVNSGVAVGALQLAIPLGEVETTLSRLRLVLIVAGLGGIALATGLGWRAAQTALRPVDDIAAAAVEIGRTQDLSRRVSAAHEDEVGQLADAFNQMLDRLDRARGELHHTLQSQRQFLADVSHELRTPLTTMRGNLEVTMRDPSMPPEDRAAAIADALEEAERMSRMVEDLLVLARTGVAQDRAREPVSLATLARDAVDAARTRANGLALTLVADGDPVVEGDADELRRVADNLIDNAIKYTPTGEIEVTTAVDDRWAVFRVRDTGPGMTPEEARHAFERFWRGVRSRGEPGSGLGLAIARAVTEKHGGTISLDSRPGEGTTLTVRLPLRGLSDARGILPQENET